MINKQTKTITMTTSIKGKALLHCKGDEGKFYVQVCFKQPQTMEQIQSGIDRNGGKVTGFRFTNVKVTYVQGRDYVATSGGF